MPLLFKNLPLFTYLTVTSVRQRFSVWDWTMCTGQPLVHSRYLVNTLKEVVVCAQLRRRLSTKREWGSPGLEVTRNIQGTA